MPRDSHHQKVAGALIVPCVSREHHAATNGMHKPFQIRQASILTDIELSKEDEAAVGKGELEVRREDQDKINKFSRLHQRETTLEDELKTKAV